MTEAPGPVRGDILTPQQRSFNMSRIRGRDTRPELIVRRGLHARGLRYRLQARELPGRPDLVLPRWRTVIFVHGCFWHGHACPMFRLPATRTAFWTAKIEATRRRDERNRLALAAADWRQLTIWECALRGPARSDPTSMLDACEGFLRGTEVAAELAGVWTAERLRT